MSLITMPPMMPVPELASATAEELERLRELQAPERVFLSCYVHLGVQDRIRARYRIAVRDAVRRLAQFLDQPGIAHVQREQLQRDLDRIELWLGDAKNLPHAPAMAIFACEALEVFRVIPLPRVRATRLLLDQRPRIAELVATVHEFGRIVAVAVDRTHARFFEFTLQETHELSGLALSAPRGGRFHSDRGDAPGWGERDYHGRRLEERHRRAIAISDVLAQLVARSPCQGIVVAGPARATAEQLRFLPRPLRRLVIGAPPLNPTSVTPAQVRKAALAARAEAERGEERVLIAELEEAMGQGWAVNGVVPTLRALSRGQLRLLVVRAGQTGWGFRCVESGRLVPARADCRGEGDPLPVADLVNEAIEAAMEEGVDVVVVDDPDAAAALDGIAGLLRFR
ncbi:MAG: hypothetical protein OEV95_05095 [Gemmatimonadota bacterium]|nr:hypothetical protein [Gemmatimonadota bacterium]